MSIGLSKIPSWQDIRAKYERRRRALRQAMLEPILVGWPVLRQVVMNALSARGHLVLCELGDVRFFVDPRDRVVGAWLMWHGGWQRREIDSAVELLRLAGRLAGAVFVDVGAHIGTHTIYALRTGRFARAIAFEPEPRNARLLTMNLEVNGLGQRALLVHKAAGAAASTGMLHLHPRNTGAHSIGAPPSVDADATVAVPIVLEGMTRLIARSVPLAFEFNPRRYTVQMKEQLVELLSRHYTTVKSLGRKDATAPIGALASRAHTDDVLVH